MKKISLLVGILLILTACSSPTPTATTNPTDFQDDFSKSNGLWQIFTEPNASAKISEGFLNMSVTAPFTVGFSVAALNINDFDYTLTVWQVSPGSANGYGMVFRYVDPQNFYRFDIAGDGKWTFSRRASDQWKPIVDYKASPAIKTGVNTPNTLRVVARKDKFEFYANNVLLGDATDSNLTLGRIGVFVSTFDDAKVDIKFDNVKVTKPN